MASEPSEHESWAGMEATDFSSIILDRLIAQTKALPLETAHEVSDPWLVIAIALYRLADQAANSRTPTAVLAQISDHLRELSVRQATTNRQLQKIESQLSQMNAELARRPPA